MQFHRTSVQLQGKTLPVLTAGYQSWVFIREMPVRVPWLLTMAPRPLSWLLQKHLQPPPNDALGVTVIPQMNCNAACRYCFQNKELTPTSVIRVDS